MTEPLHRVRVRSSANPAAASGHDGQLTCPSSADAELRDWVRRDQQAQRRYRQKDEHRRRYAAQLYWADSPTLAEYNARSWDWRFNRCCCAYRYASRNSTASLARVLVRTVLERLRAERIRMKGAG